MWLRAESVRILLSIALFASVVFMPWWLCALFAAALTVRFRAWEVIAAGILYDLLWMPAGIAFSWGGMPFATVISLILVLGLEPLRRQLLVGPSIL